MGSPWRGGRQHSASLRRRNRTFTQLAETLREIERLDEFLTGFVRQIKEELDALVVSTRIVDTSDEFMEI